MCIGMASAEIKASDAEQTRPGHELASSPTSLFDIKILIVATSVFLLLVCALSINLTLRWALRRLAMSRSHVDSACHVTPGLKKCQLNSLPILIYNSLAQSEAATSSQCPICLVNFVDAEKIRMLPKCEHIFHVNCVDKWLTKNSSCPTCRGNIMDAMSAEATTSQVQVRIVIAQGGTLSSSICKEEPTIKYFC